MLLVRNFTGLLTSSKKISQSCQAVFGGLKKHVIYSCILLGFLFILFYFCLCPRLNALDHP